MNKIFMSSKKHEDNVYSLDLDSQSSLTNHVFYVLGEVG